MTRAMYMAMVFLMATAVVQATVSAIDLGTAGRFVLLTKTGVTTTGDTTVTGGDMGVSPAAATYIESFDLMMDASNEFSTSTLVNDGTPSTCQVSGCKVYAASYDALRPDGSANPTPAMMTTAISDMETAYTDAAGRSDPDETNLGDGDIEGMTLKGGLHRWGTSVTLNEDKVLTFDAEGDANTVWILQIAKNLVLRTGAQVTLTSGAKASNIFWQVAEGAEILAGAHMKGIILSKTAITFGAGSTLTGRGLAQTAVTMIATTIVAP